ncbi:hypothetical protein, partial [Allocoleopsis sp.]|uniref:hypothetical protein n=1 Tax=Allocoleopsis sp. TaxID=3088169 RepID=UPI002FD4472C
NRLKQGHDTWESIEKDLMALIQGNANLNQAFQEIRRQLDEMDDEELLDLMPSETKQKVTSDTNGVVTYDSVASASKGVTELGILEQLLVQLRGEISLRKADPQLAFETLASEWKEQVGGSSFVVEKTNHPAYQKIIEMGSVVVPFLLRELEQKPTHWFEALKAITGANPVQPEQRGRTKQMAQAWLQWGREQGYNW